MMVVVMMMMVMVMVMMMMMVMVMMLVGPAVTIALHHNGRRPHRRVPDPTSTHRWCG